MGLSAGIENRLIIIVCLSRSIGSIKTQKAISNVGFRTLFDVNEFFRFVRGHLIESSKKSRDEISKIYGSLRISGGCLWTEILGVLSPGKKLFAGLLQISRVIIEILYV